MKFLDFIKEKEDNFLWEYLLIQKSNTINFDKEKTYNKLNKSILMIRQIIQNKGRILFIISKADLKIIPEIFFELFRITNSIFITTWYFGQLTNKISFRNDSSNFIFKKSKFQDLFVVINPKKNIKIIKEINCSGNPLITVGDIDFIQESQINIHINLYNPININRFFTLLANSLLFFNIKNVKIKKIKN